MSIYSARLGEISEIWHRTVARFGFIVPILVQIFKMERIRPVISKINKSLKASVAVAITAGSFATAAAAEDFRMLASWDSSYPIVPKVADVFAKDLKRFKYEF